MAAVEKALKMKEMKGMAGDAHRVIFMRIKWVTIYKALRNSAWHIVNVMCLQVKCTSN